MQRVTRRGFLGSLGIAGTAPVLGAVTVHAQRPSGSVAIEKDVVFGKGAQIDLRLDIFRPPPGTEKRMATIHLHGGGFGGGNKETLTERVQPFAARGFVAIASQYRLTGQAKWPAPIHDVKAAIRWTRANASSLGIDPERIAIVGYSAGGHFALFAAVTQNQAEFEGDGGNPGAGTAVACCFAYYPVTDISRAPDGSAHQLMPTGSGDAAHRAASPTSYIAAGFPPTTIFHGTRDTTVPLENSQRLFQALLDKGVSAELHAFDGQTHIFDRQPEFADACASLAGLFADRHVVNPARYRG